MTRPAKPELIHWFSRTVHAPGNVEALRRAVAARRGGVMLESVAAGGPWGQYSFYSFEPIRMACIDGQGGADPFIQLASECRPWGRFESPPPWPFVGGWVGYLGYEAGRFVEPRAGWDDRGGGLPMSYWGLYDTVLICDHRRGEWVVAGVELPAARAVGWPSDVNERIAEWEALVVSTSQAIPRKDPTLALPLVRGGDSGVSCGDWSETRGEYLRKVERVLDYIRAGDVYQVNLARRFRARFDEEPVALYQRLCESNPAGFAAMLQVEPEHRLLAGATLGGAAQVISSSPELFLQVRGRDVVTRPIKGTRARGGNGREDAARRAELAASEKDRAELAMIVDLERNDLGRVCEYGSVRVVSEGEIEALPTVFHRTATVAGRLREDRDAIDLLRATFPGGSITGAPKIRAMQIINELEDFARGPYCGAMGWIGLNGDMMLNLAIRTMAVAGGQVEICVGSGIVADSVPEEEYLELEAKAAGMMRALKHQSIKTPKRQNGRGALAVTGAHG